MAGRSVARYPANYDYYHGDPYSEEDYSMSRYRPRTRSADHYGYDDRRRSYDYDRDYYSPRRSTRSPEYSHPSPRRSRSDDRHRSSRHSDNRHHRDRHSSSSSSSHHHHHHHHRSRHQEPPRRSTRRSQDTAVVSRKDTGSDTKLNHAAHAALDAAAVEAVRIRKQPGEWNGSKGIRVATAALGAMAIGSAQDTTPGKHSKRHLVEATVGGLLANRAVNGPRDDLRRRR